MKLKCKSSTGHALLHQFRQQPFSRQQHSSCLQLFQQSRLSEQQKSRLSEQQQSTWSGLFQGHLHSIRARFSRLCRIIAVAFLIGTSTLFMISCTLGSTTTTASGEIPAGISSSAGASVESSTDVSSTTLGAAKINPDWQGYKGYIYAPSYVYRYSDERNRKWEEAIIKLANDYLDPATGHVRLLDQENTHLFVNADMVRTAVLRNIFDKDRYAFFVKGIEDTISKIHTSTDLELRFALVSTIHGLSESHTALLTPMAEKAYCMEFVVQRDQGEMKVYCARALKDQQSVEGSELRAVNGVELEEIVEKLMPYAWGYDDLSRKISLFQTTTSFPYMNSWDLLEMLGIVEGEQATFTFRDRDGNLQDLEVSPVTREAFMEFAYYLEDVERPYDSFFMNHSDKQLWFRHLDDDTVYVRIQSFLELSDTDPDLLALVEYLSQTKQSKKMVLDLRGNTGGHALAHSRLFVALRDFDSEQKYVLVDTVTNSASIVMAHVLKYDSGDQVKIVGTNCWHTIMAFGDLEGHFVALPGFGEVQYTVPLRGYCLSDDGLPLKPDVELFWEHEDFINGRDTYLEWVKRQ